MPKTLEDLRAEQAELARQIAAAELAARAGEVATIGEILDVYTQFNIEGFMAALKAKVSALPSGPARMHGENTLQVLGASAKRFAGIRSKFEAEKAAATAAAMIAPAPEAAPAPPVVAPAAPAPEAGA